VVGGGGRNGRYNGDGTASSQDLLGLPGDAVIDHDYWLSVLNNLQSAKNRWILRSLHCKILLARLEQMLARSGGGAILLDDVPVLPREGSGVAVESLGFSGHQPSKLALGAEEERELAAASANEGIHTNSTSSSSRSSGFSSGETQEERTDRYIRAHLTSLQERGVLGSRGSDGDVGKAGEEGMEGGESRDIGASLEVMGAEAEVAVPSSVVPTKGSIQHRNLTLAESIAFSDKYRTRKPRYFNKVKTGYDWNKCVTAPKLRARKQRNIAPPLRAFVPYSDPHFFQFTLSTHTLLNHLPVQRTHTRTPTSDITRLTMTRRILPHELFRVTCSTSFTPTFWTEPEHRNFAWSPAWRAKILF